MFPGLPPRGKKLATIAELEKECKKFGTDCENYPDMTPNDPPVNCNAADGRYFGGKPPAQLVLSTDEAKETSCYMSNPDICDGKGCFECESNCTYTIYNDYKCEGDVKEYVGAKGDTKLIVANKTGSVMIHGRGCEITFYENHDKTGQSSQYSSDTPGITDKGDCNYCVQYACDYLKDDEETLVTTEATENCR